MVQMEPKKVTGGSVEESLKTLAEKVDRLQTMIESLTGALEAVTSHDVQNMTGIMPVCVQVEEQKNTQAGMMQGSGQKRTGFNPAPVDAENVTVTDHTQATANPDSIPDGIEQATNVTETVTIQTIEKTAEPIQAIMSPVSDQKESKALWVITEQDAKGTLNDTINDDLDTALIRARGLLAAKQALLLKEKQKQPGAHASIGDEFKALFGVNVPVGFMDMAAVETMVNRKKSGKLDNVKSPLAYLSSLAGKVTPIVTTPAGLKTSPMGNIHSVTDTSLNDYEQRRRIKATWFGLDAEQRMPFHELREKKAMPGMPSGKVPIELLAFQQFTQECLAGRVQI